MRSGNRLVKKYSDFDVRSYGYSSLSKFLEEMDSFELKKSNNVVTVRMKDNRTRKQELDDYAIKLVKTAEKERSGAGSSGQRHAQEIRRFQGQGLRLLHFSKFVQSISQLEIRENKINNKVVFIRQA